MGVSQSPPDTPPTANSDGGDAHHQVVVDLKDAPPPVDISHTESKSVDKTSDDVDFKDVSIAEALDILKCSREGLSSADAQARLEQYGPNRLPEKKRYPILQFLGYMWNPLSWAMEAAAILAIALLDYVDFALILGLLLLNASISFYEESNADKAIKALTAALAPKGKALRDGKWETIDAQNLVPGDIVLLKFGDIIPADVKLLGEAGHDDQVVQIDQAALTGESLPVKKRAGDVAFSGSAVKQGEIPAVVYATGKNTFFGRAATLLEGTDNVANLQKVMNKIGAICLITIFTWVIIELPVMFAHWDHSCKGGEGGCPALTNLLVIIVGGIPIAMPTVLSVTLALGAFKLAKEGAIVARMSAVEEMAGMDILCSDKTGTLTLNKLSIEPSMVFPLGRFTVDDAMMYGALSANIVTEEPIDMVLYHSYTKHKSLKDTHSTGKFIPFNPTDKYTVAYVTEASTGKQFMLMKGAPQVVLRHSHNAADIGTVVNSKITEFANRGFRALGVSYADGHQDVASAKFEMVAVVPLFDPPRHDTKDTIDRCLAMGVHVKMVTGDQTLIGKETARQLGMSTDIYTIDHLHAARDAGQNMSKLVEEAGGFAEVFPEHKFEVVEVLQKGKHIVGMTGDGVNDAPALKKADVGIAVAGATDAARGAADIVLTEAGLSAIATAIIGARKIFQRMTTYARYTIAMTFRITFTFGLLTCIFNWFFPTILIVLLAVFNDGAMIALAKDRVQPSQTPSMWKIRNIFTMGVGYGLYLTASTILLYCLAALTTFFTHFGLPDLNTSNSNTRAFCTDRAIPVVSQSLGLNLSPSSPVSQVYPNYNFANVGNGLVPTVLQQCQTEVAYLRDSQLRSMIYLQVSVSGQALIFVVRDLQWSFRSRAGLFTYIAFFLAQFAATIIALFGFNGYTFPRDAVEKCQFCRQDTSGLSFNPFWSKRAAPVFGTEGEAEASCIGAIGWVILSWIWAFIWHLGLDPLKWVMAYLINDDGFRDRNAFLKQRQRPAALDERQKLEEATVPGLVAPSYNNPLGRVSILRPSAQVNLDRASVLERRSAMVTDTTLQRASILSRGSVGGNQVGPAAV